MLTEEELLVAFKKLKKFTYKDIADAMRKASKEKYHGR